MKGELKSLTSVRGLAAWMVVAYHVRAATPWLPEGVMNVMHKGYLAVDFFFLLSGFVIYLSAHDSFLREGAAAAPGFLVRRLARIYPLHALILGGAIAFALVLAATGRSTSNYPWAELPLHLTLTQNWGLTTTLSWNHPAWSISTEFAAYLIFPALVLWTPIARTGRAGLATAIVTLLLLLAAILHGAGETTLGGDIPRFGLIRCLIEFSAGAALCAFWLRGKAHDPWEMGLAFAGAALFLGAWAAGAVGEIVAFPMASACMILALTHASGLPRNPLHWRPFHYLGEVSYATYLAHFMLFIGFKIILVNDSGVAGPGLIALFFGLTFIVSAVLHHFVEVPGRRWLSIRPNRDTFVQAAGNAA